MIGLGTSTGDFMWTYHPWRTLVLGTDNKLREGTIIFTQRWYGRGKYKVDGRAFLLRGDMDMVGANSNEDT